MSFLQNQPSNKNFLSQVGFKVDIARIPNVSYFTQSINIPGVEMPVANVPTMLNNYPLYGNKLKYRDVTVTFSIDENMSNYIEIYDWITGLTHPQSSDQYKELNNKELLKDTVKVSDGIITVLTSSRNPNVEIRLINMFPISLTDVIFDSREGNISPLQATAIFRITRFEIKKL